MRRDSTWITQTVQLPNELSQALRDGNLVIFAGAGVSMGMPSDILDFNRLTSRVAVEAGGLLTRRDNEPNDRFLGRLKKQGIDVHKIVHSVVSDPKSRPNDIHRFLGSLFLNKSQLRIITTNFDPHFSTVCDEMFEDGVPTFSGPALPSGSDFHGLIYLHGSSKDQPHQLVLTDEDFGRAYLTNGWATRFLQDMFQRFTVLFVGYSHDDPIVTYLARGLPPGTSRYAFGRKDDEERWRFLDIKLVGYPVFVPNDHHALPEAVDAWATLEHMTFKEHRTRIHSLVINNPTELNHVDKDYLIRSVQAPYTVWYLTERAEGIQWLKWFEGEGLLDGLFERDAEWADHLTSLGFWFVTHFVMNNSHEGLAVIERHGQRLHRNLWNIIAGTLSEQAPLADPAAFAHWVSVLLASQEVDAYSSHLPEILKRCRPEEDAMIAIVLFDHLTTPRLTLTENEFRDIHQESKPVFAEVKFVPPNDGNALREIWGGIFKNNLSIYAKKIETVLTRQIQKAHDLLRSIRNATNDYDIMSWTTKSLDPVSDVDKYLIDSFHVLIEAARDVLLYTLQSDLSRAQRLIDDWATSGVPFLQRLAIYGQARNVALSDDEKIRWIINNGWFHSFRGEVMSLLQGTFAKASPETQQLLVYELERTARELPVNKDAQDFSLFKAFWWLNTFDPDNELVLIKLRTIQSDNPHFGPTEFSKDGFRFIDMPDPVNPWTTQELLQFDPTKVQEVFEKEEGTEPLLFDAIRTTAKDFFDWSWTLVNDLLQNHFGKESPLIVAVLKGWRDASLTTDEWTHVLDLLQHPTLIQAHALWVNGVLLHGLEQSQTFPDTAIKMARDIASKILHVIFENDKSNPTISKDVIQISRALPGGEVMRVWLALLDRENQLGSLSEIPTLYRETFYKFIHGQTEVTAIGRIVLMTALDFLHAIDPVWTEHYLFPLLNWENGVESTRAAWYGYLQLARISPTLTTAIREQYEKTFGHLQDLDFIQDLFINRVVTICAYGVIDPREDHWIRKFIVRADENVRTKWALGIHRELHNQPADRKTELWTQWIKPYWEERISGLPISLGNAESAKMMNWAFVLQPVFSDVCKCICQNPVPVVDLSNIYYGLMAFVNDFPKEVALVLCHLLPKATLATFQFAQNVIGIYERLKEHHGLAPELEIIEEQLTRLGRL